MELSYFLGAMGCSNHLDVRNCNNPAEENNYADYVNLETTRRAIHVGDIPFGAQVIRVCEIYDNRLQLELHFRVAMFMTTSYPT